MPKVETYIKVIMELGLSEARSVRDALSHRPATDPSDPIFHALNEELAKVAHIDDEEVAA